MIYCPICNLTHSIVPSSCKTCNWQKEHDIYLGDIPEEVKLRIQLDFSNHLLIQCKEEIVKPNKKIENEIINKNNETNNVAPQITLESNKLNKDAYVGFFGLTLMSLVFTLLAYMIYTNWVDTNTNVTKGNQNQKINKSYPTSPSTSSSLRPPKEDIKKELVELADQIRFMTKKDKVKFKRFNTIKTQYPKIYSRVKTENNNLINSAENKIETTTKGGLSNTAKSQSRTIITPPKDKVNKNAISANYQQTIDAYRDEMRRYEANNNTDAEISIMLKKLKEISDKHPSIEDDYKRMMKIYHDWRETGLAKYKLKRHVELDINEGETFDQFVNRARVHYGVTNKITANQLKKIIKRFNGSDVVGKDDRLYAGKKVKMYIPSPN